MQHSKRASIYVSDASIILAQRAPIVSPVSSHDSLLSPSGEAADFIDHYSILQLGPEASDEEITSAFRQLRAVYFQSDATKYKALTAAFDLLRDPEARQAYDVMYHARATLLSLSGEEDVSEQVKHERKDSAMGDEAAKLAVLKEEEELEALRSQDPNWALKHHQQAPEPLVRKTPHQSYIPISVVYDARKSYPMRMCSRPTYIDSMARNA